MQTYHLHRGRGLAGLERSDVPTPVPRPGEVRVRVRAVALNARDLAIARADAAGPPLVPGSDAVGEVVALGEGVAAWAPGDRVLASFYPAWTDGPPTAANTATALGGGGAPGVLAAELVLPADALCRAPAQLDDAEAATLPCAGVTAWNALFEAHPLRPGATVLVLGTGGVSLWALQLATAAGLRVIVTSSSDDKLQRAKALGAWATLNYRTQPAWAPAVRALTGGRGVDLVLETGGRATLAASIEATAMGGSIALVGGTSGAFGGELAPFALIDGAQRLTGINVGSRAMLQSLAAFVDAQRLRPVVDRVFPFAQAAQAYAHLASGAHVGKVVVAGPQRAEAGRVH